jgi:hypothetical protein
MKSRARATWVRRFVQSEIAKMTKALDPEFSLRWEEALTRDLILSAWDFDEVYRSNTFDDVGDSDHDTLTDVENRRDDLENPDLGLLAVFGPNPLTPRFI